MTGAGDSPVVQCPVRRWRDGQWEVTQDSVAEESPVALLFNSIPHVVMMASPKDLEDFAVGFSLSEGLLASVDDIEALQVEVHPEGMAVQLTCRPGALPDLSARRRNLTGRTGCGLCGAESLAQAVRPRPKAASRRQRLRRPQLPPQRHRNTP